MNGFAQLLNSLSDMEESRLKYGIVIQCKQICERCSKEALCLINMGLVIFSHKEMLRETVCWEKSETKDI